MRRAVERVIEARQSKWDKLLTQTAKASGTQRWATLRKRFRNHTLESMQADARKASKQAQMTLERRRSTMAARHEAKTRMRQSTRHLELQANEAGESMLRAQIGSIVHSASKAEQSSNPAWGGVGWQYSVAEGEHAKLRKWQAQQLDAMAMAFDQRHESFSSGAQKLLQTRGHRLSDSAVQRRAMDKCLFGLRANRWTQQPLRLDSNVLSPRSGYAYEEWGKPLAHAGNMNGPLVPVYERQFETDSYDVSEPESEPEPIEWTLYSSIWGPRCESCDGRDFVDHAEVVFERFVTDWQCVLRLGLAKMIMTSDDGGTVDADGDGLPDEVEDVGAVLLMHHQLCTLAWMWYSDAVFGSGSDLDVGVKLNQGWREFTGDCGIWSHMSQKDAACANSLIFLDVDRMDRATAAATHIQATYRGRSSRRTSCFGSVPGERRPPMDEAVHAAGLKEASKAALEAAGKSVDKKSDNSLSRCEFIMALVKTAIVRFITSKELTDVSDALECLFEEHIQPALEVPSAGCQQPRLPVPDTFRLEVCYKQALCEQLEACSASLRVIFAGLAKIAVKEHDPQSAGVKMPRLGESKALRREGAQWIKVPGYVSYPLWRRFAETLFPAKILDLRRTTLIFLYSIMAVVDGSSGEGRVQDRHLTFEGFLEAIVRLAAWLPLPSEAQLAESKFEHAGPWLSALEARGGTPALQDLQAKQACEWGGVPKASVAGEMAERVKFLIDVIVRKIKLQPDVEADAPLVALTRREFRHWVIQTMPASTASALTDVWVEAKVLGETDRRQ